MSDIENNFFTAYKEGNLAEISRLQEKTMMPALAAATLNDEEVGVALEIIAGQNEKRDGHENGVRAALIARFLTEHPPTQGPDPARYLIWLNKGGSRYAFTQAEHAIIDDMMLQVRNYLVERENLGDPSLNLQIVNAVRHQFEEHFEKAAKAVPPMEEGQS